MASYLHRTAQPSTLATFRSWGSSTGAGRIRLAAANIQYQFGNESIWKFENERNSISIEINSQISTFSNLQIIKS